MEKKAYTVKEIKAALQLDRMTVYRLLRERKLHGIKAGRGWRVPSDALAEFLRGGGSEEKQAA